MTRYMIIDHKDELKIYETLKVAHRKLQKAAADLTSASDTPFAFLLLYRAALEWDGARRFQWSILGRDGRTRSITAQPCD